MRQLNQFDIKCETHKFIILTESCRRRFQSEYLEMNLFAIFTTNGSDFFGIFDAFNSEYRKKITNFVCAFNGSTNFNRKSLCLTLCRIHYYLH